MSKRKFRVELGVNLYAASVTRTNANMRLFPLQDNLIELKSKKKSRPAWFTRLSPGDKISFRLVDISALRKAAGPPPNYPQSARLDLRFNDPETGQRSSPTKEHIMDWRISDQLKYRHSPVFSQPKVELFPSWDIYGIDVVGRETRWIRMADVGDEDYRAFELSGTLIFEQDGWINHFVFDPEMIVSETDNAGGS